MSDNLAKQNIKKAINKLFSLQFYNMKEDKNYIELVRICKNVKGIPPRYWLILNLLELLFIEDNKLKNNCEKDEAIKYFDYLLNRKKYINSDFQKEFFIYIQYEKYQKIFKGANFISSKEIQIIGFIAKVITDFKLLFNCIDFLYSMNLPNYISCQKNLEFTGNLETYLEQLETFLEYNDFENAKEYFSLCYNNKDEFYFDYYTLEETKDLKNKFNQDKTFKDIKKFIINNSVKISNDQSNNNINYSEIKNKEYKEKNDLEGKEVIKKITNEKTDENEKDSLNENIGLSSLILNEEQNKLYKLIKDELNKDFEKKLNDQSKDYDEKIENIKKKIEDKMQALKKDYDNILEINEIYKKQTNEMKNEYDNKIRRLKKKHECDINNINNQNSKFKKTVEILFEREKDKYNNLHTKYDSANLIYAKK